MLTGCTIIEKEKETSPVKKLTIEPYYLSEKESLLISKTGVELIEFFKLKGTLKEDDDLQFSVEVFENGKFKEVLLHTSIEPETKFKDSLISFGLCNLEDTGQSDIKLLAGLPTGLATASYPNNMTSSSFSTLIDKNITLERNNPVYLSAWLGTTKIQLPSAESENGKLPEAIKEAELSFLYKVVWIDNERE